MLHYVNLNLLYHYLFLRKSSFTWFECVIFYYNKPILQTNLIHAAYLEMQQNGNTLRYT